MTVTQHKPGGKIGTREHVALLRGRGFAVCRPDAGEKRPTYKYWPTRSLEVSEFGDDAMVGILGGSLSDGGKPGHALCVVDLDSPEAVASADAYLPRTDMTEGRKGKLRSHRYFLVPVASVPEWGISEADQAAPAAKKKTGHAGPFTKSFTHCESGKEVIRFIGTGGQCVCPPSEWRSEDGTQRDRRKWHGGTPGEPAVVEFLDLWNAVGELASACGAEIPDVMPHEPFVLRVPDARDQALRYVAKVPGAVSGAGGHDAALWAARCAVLGFDLGESVGFELLRDHWNSRCSPPWSEKELRHKCDAAARLPFNKPRGWLLDPSRAKAATATATPHVNGDSSLIITRMSDLKARPVRYLVPGRIPRGKLILVAGRGGCGKSTWSRSLAASISTGRCAFGLTYPNPVAGKVLLLSVEDGPADTILPDLIAAGADLDKIAILDGVKHGGGKRDFTLLPEHVELLRKRVTESPEIRLIVIDPIASFVGRAKVDDHRSAELRQVLDPLSKLAEESGVTILLLAHVNKDKGDAVDRIAGSAAYRDAVRAAYLATEDPEDETRRLIIPIKENLPGFDRTAIPFSLEKLSGLESSAIMLHDQFSEVTDSEDRQAMQEQLRRVRFHPPVKANADEATNGKKDKGKVQGCIDWLKTFLSKYAYPSDEILAAAKAARFTFDNLKDAKARLRSEDFWSSNRGSFQGVWWCGFGKPESWTLRPEATPHSPDSPETPDSPDSPHYGETRDFSIVGSVGSVGSVVPTPDGLFQNPDERLPD